MSNISGRLFFQIGFCCQFLCLRQCSILLINNLPKLFFVQQDFYQRQIVVVFQVDIKCSKIIFKKIYIFCKFMDRFI